MDHSPFTDSGREKEFDTLWFGFWFVSSIFGGTIGHYWTWYLGVFVYNSEVSGLFEHLFISLLPLNSIVIGLLGASLVQGWLLRNKGIVFRQWAAVSVLGYVVGIALIYLLDGAGPNRSAWGIPLSTVIVSVLQADQLRDHVPKPFGWAIAFPVLMVPMYAVFLASYFLAAFSNDFSPQLVLSLVIGFAVGIAATISFKITKPNSKVDLRTDLYD